jgi:prepilin-type N-terminal cleavage/methylation domain-containing protein
VTGRVRTAFTLVEVVVVLALLGLILGISGLAMGSLRNTPRTTRARLLVAARDSAIRFGVSVIVTMPWVDVATDTATATVLFLPDGRALGRGVDPLSGVPHATR